MLLRLMNVINRGERNSFDCFIIILTAILWTQETTGQLVYSLICIIFSLGLLVRDYKRRLISINRQHRLDLVGNTIKCNRLLVFPYFIKAFNTVKNMAIAKALDQCRIDHRYIRSIYNMYKNSTACVNLHQDTKIRIRISGKETQYHPNCARLRWSAPSRNSIQAIK